MVTSNANQVSNRRGFRNFRQTQLTPTQMFANKGRFVRGLKAADISNRGGFSHTGIRVLEVAAVEEIIKLRVGGDRYDNTGIRIKVRLDKENLGNPATKEVTTVTGLVGASDRRYPKAQQNQYAFEEILAANRELLEGATHVVATHIVGEMLKNGEDEVYVRMIGVAGETFSIWQPTDGASEDEDPDAQGQEPGDGGEGEADDPDAE